MEKKIKILFFNKDKAGVNYYRTLTPAMELERNFDDKFDIEINSNIDFNDEKTLDYLKSFDIIHYHRQMVENTNIMIQLKKELESANTKLVMDVDDYWHLDKSHPYYPISVENKMHVPIIENLKIADYVTTTTDYFADEIRKITGKDNVFVFYNAVNPEWMKQFEDNRKESEDGKVRITYMAGSSHKGDVEQLRTVVNVLHNDPQTKGKFKFILSGFDTEGTTTEVKFNEELGEELKKMGLWTQEIVKMINKTRGNIDLIDGIPTDLKDKYRGKVFETSQRPIESKESVYYDYEQILTDDYKIIKDKNYFNWLMNFEKNESYDNEDNYARRWTQKVNIYANVLNETDIMIAPLSNHKFNLMKSNLKQVECWSRKIPVVCSDVVPYNTDGKHMENCVLIRSEKNAHKYWKKYLKRLILDKELREKIGQNLYDSFKEKYHLTNVTENRAEFYQKIIK